MVLASGAVLDKRFEEVAAMSAKVRVVDLLVLRCADSKHGDLPQEAKPRPDLGLQCQVGAGVVLQDLRHRARFAQLLAPGRR
jgi:hypothetical protein